MSEFYELKVAGLTRQLPVFKLNDELSIAAFVIFGDVELTVACASHLIKIMPEHDIMITAEAKSIPLIHEIARQRGENSYIVARKGLKVYMKDPVSVEVNSITTAKKQTLYIDKTASTDTTASGKREFTILCAFVSTDSKSFTETVENVACAFNIASCAKAYGELIFALRIEREL